MEVLFIFDHYTEVVQKREKLKEKKQQKVFMSFYTVLVSEKA